MKVISISKRKFENLQQFDVSDVNTEGVLYKLSYQGQEKLLKKLYVNNGIVLAKKLFTIELLNDNDLPDYFIIPDSLVSVSGNVVGFSIPCITGITLKSLLDNSNFSNEIKIEYLKKIGLILKNMEGIRCHTDLKHFYLNDIHESNFVVDYDTGNLCAVDLDSCRINKSFSFPSRYLTSKALLNNVNKYQVEDDMRHGAYVIANLDSDLYCYIIIILNFLYGENINNVDLNEFYEYLNYLSYIGIDRNLINCFNRIVSYGSNVNPIDYLDSLTDEQICRAKKMVYQIVKKRT